MAFLVATIAAENRVPFDILEAESELVAGFRVEYSGMKFALIQLAEYAHMIASSFLAALLFLGGWLGPGPAWLGPLWFLLKAVAIFLLVTWVRWSFVRIRVDQILAISWKLLLPATLDHPARHRLLGRGARRRWPLTARGSSAETGAARGRGGTRHGRDPAQLPAQARDRPLSRRAAAPIPTASAGSSP